MIITDAAKYYKTIAIVSRLEAQWMREACVVSRPLVLRALVGAAEPEQARRMRRALQDIYHAIDSLTGNRSRTRFPEPLYLHVSPEEMRLLCLFLEHTSAAELHGSLDERAAARVGTLATITPAWDALRSRWTGSVEQALHAQRFQAVSA